MNDASRKDIFEKLTQRVVCGLVYPEDRQLLDQVADRFVYLYLRLLVLTFLLRYFSIIRLLWGTRNNVLSQLYRARDHRQRDDLVY